MRNTVHPSARTPGLKAQRRGFVFLMVLMLMAIAAIVLAAGLQRSTVHNAIVERQIDGYRNHHEMLGVRDYCGWWLQKRDNTSARLAELAASGEVAHRLSLDNGVVVLISVQDGQGTVLRSLDTVQDVDTQRWLVEVLSRLPQGRPDLTRRSGNWRLSLKSAPDEVLDALAAFDGRTFEALREGRAAKDASEFQLILERRRVEPLVQQVLLNGLIFEPTLWRLNIEVVHPDRISRYTLLAEKKLNSSKLHEWRPVGESEAQRTFTSTLSELEAAEGGVTRP